MKIRSGFVSNSSSSSFVINKYYLSQFQIDAIHLHRKYADELGLIDDPWYISETDDEIKGYTVIDNFNMRRFLDHIRVDPQWIGWEGEEARRPFGR